MAADNINNYQLVYNVREDESLSSHVTSLICVLTRRALLVAGFSSTKELLTIHHKGYNTNKPVWDIEFFEHLFTHYPLLAERDKVKGVFLCSHKNMVVPDELYDATEAKNWLKRLYFIEPNDAIDAYPLKEDKAHYIQAVPLAITELIKINFKKAAILPLPIYHFKNNHQQSYYLQCCISDAQATATLHNEGQLLWHHVFNYSVAEDIAYHIQLFCKESNIDVANLTIICDATTSEEYEVINGLSQYFPGFKSDNTTGNRWGAAISLANQLFACV